MLKWLIVTTDEDRSIESLRQAHVDVVKYEDTKIPAAEYDVVYFRDPFNELTYNLEDIGLVVSNVTRLHEDAYFVDGCRSLDDLLFEDKWRQYQKLHMLMPHTELLSESLKTDSKIIKQRISSRARGIYFDTDEIPHNAFDQYLIQPRLDIAVEYRVYVVCDGGVLPKVSVKSTKSEKQAVKVLDVVDMSSKLEAFCHKVIEQLPGMDFIGLDIAELSNGDLVLIEVNRSPQFSRYDELLGTNTFSHVRYAVEQKVASL